ncbi:MAG: AAA family ATPase [Nannocystaceae bacterium]
MPTIPTEEQLELGLKIVQDGPGEHHDALDKLGTRIGAMWVFGDERDHVENLQKLIETWLARPGPERPLCVALFGPPGSGKSFAVKQILAAYAKRVEAKDRPLWAQAFRTFTLNLTQFEHGHELALALSKIPGRLARGELPVVFFDEFDAPRGARDLGWLPWFLAPMQDGEWMLDGETRVLRQAIYVFAGGTADTRQDFAKDGDDAEAIKAARLAKRNDFLSRLRGTLDICGPNAEPKILRRALILRHQLESYNDTWLGARDFVRKTLSVDAVRWLLQVGTLEHGARSLGALLDGCIAKAETEELSQEDFAKSALAPLHIGESQTIEANSPPE